MRNSKTECSLKMMACHQLSGKGLLRVSMHAPNTATPRPCGLNAFAASPCLNAAGAAAQDASPRASSRPASTTSAVILIR